jgi:hypothetical protein
VRRSSAPQRLVKCAQVILLLAAGKAFNQVARALGVLRHTVYNRWMRPGFLALLGAGTVAASIVTRGQSSWSASPRQGKSCWCSFGHTPTACQSWRRRQHGIPLPQPISRCSNSQGMPRLSLKRRPVSMAPLGIRRRPPVGRGGGAGSKSCSTAHSSSDKISFAIAVLPPSPIYRSRDSFVRK